MKVFILIVFLLNFLPAYCNEEIINEFITDEKIISKIGKTYSRRLECKRKPKQDLSLDSDSQKNNVNCPVITCPVDNKCTLSTFLPYLRSSYKLSIPIIENIEKKFELKITEINHSKNIFSYRVSDSEREVIYKDGKGYIDGNTVFFTVPLYNWGRLYSTSCIGFVQDNGLINGACNTFEDNGKNLYRVGVRFKAVPDI